MSFACGQIVGYEADVLILIILEVFYEVMLCYLQTKMRSLNPYYTGSTLWACHVSPDYYM